AEEDRQAGGLAEHAVIHVEQRDRAVLHLVYHRCISRADQCRVHLVRRGGEGAADDLRRDRVERGDGHYASSAISITSVPSSSTRACESGGTTVVAVCSTTIAGPGTAAPGCRSSRRTSCAVRSRRPNTTRRSS